MDRAYVSHGLRARAGELATQWLGPRPERQRVDQLRREAELEQSTSLDFVLERRETEGVVQMPWGGRDRHLDSALRKRLEVLRTLGLAVDDGDGVRLHPELRQELRRMERRAEGMRAIAQVLSVSGDRCRVIDREEPKDGERSELERGVQGIVRWKGLDEQGQFCAVVETTGGAAYYLPISSRAAQQTQVGRVVEIKRAVDKDERIEEAARRASWTYELGALPEGARPAYRGRLEQLERMGLAASDGPDRWRLQRLPGKPRFPRSSRCSRR